jgi:DNA-binding transcriptional ArsR family regulator
MTRGDVLLTRLSIFRQRELVPQDSLESDHCAEMLRALADPVRLRIIDALRSAPQCVSALSESLGIEVVTISHHLGILHGIGLLAREKKGRFKVYRLREGILDPAAAGRGKQHIDLGCCRLEIPAPVQIETNGRGSPKESRPSAHSEPHVE